MKLKLLFLAFVIPFYSWGQAVTQQTKTPSSGTNAGNSYFSWYSGAFNGYFIPPYGANATLNRAADINGLFYVQLSDSTIRFRYNGSWIPIGSGLANPTGTIGFTAVNGSATTGIRSDGAPKADSTVIRSVANSSTLAQAQILRGNYYTPEQAPFNAVGDGSTNDNTAIQQCLDSAYKYHKAVYATKKYLITGALNLRCNILGNGSGQFITASNNAIFSDTTANLVIQGVSFIGNGSVSGNTHQHGILLTGNGRSTKISNCHFLNLGGFGIEAHDIHLSGGIGKYDGFQAVNCLIESCYGGEYMYNTAEYNSNSNVTITYCKTTGFRNFSGNNSFTGGEITHNDTNVYIGTGTNDGHCYIVGTKINHGTPTAIYTNNVALGFLIAHCDIYYGNITLAGTSTAIQLDGNNISQDNSADTLTVASTTYGVIIKNNWWYTNPQVVSTTNANILWLNNTWVSGPIAGTTGYARYDNLIYDQNMGIKAIDPLGQSYGKSLSVQSTSGLAGVEVNANATAAHVRLGVGGISYADFVGTSGGSSIGSVGSIPFTIKANNNIVAEATTNNNFLINTLADTTRFKLQVNGLVRFTQFTAASSNDSLVAFNPKQHGLRMTKLANSTGETITYGAGTITLGNDTTVLQTVLNFFPKGDTRYLKLTGGTLTGVLSGTSASFSGNVGVNALIIANLGVPGGSSTSLSATSPQYIVASSGYPLLPTIVVLPDATTLLTGQIYEFNNNATGSLQVQTYGGSNLYLVPPGGYVKVILTSNSFSAGQWDEHVNAPANAFWGTAGLTVTGSLTSTSFTSTIKPSTVYQTPAGTAGTDSVMVKHSDGTVKAISPTYYGTGTGTGLANPTGTIGFTAVNGSATTGMRSDGAPKADSTIIRSVANSNSLATEQILRGNYYTPEQAPFNAVGDGITNDNTAIQQCLDSAYKYHKAVYATKKYLITGALNLRCNILGNGSGQFITASNNAVFSDTTSNLVIQGISFIGGGSGTGNTHQHGILLTGNGRSTKISNCHFLNLGGFGIEAHDINLSGGIGKYDGTQGVNLYIESCYGGIYFYNTAEYNSFANTTITACKTTGFRNFSGNNSFTGGEITHNDTNVYIGTGTNDGHCYIVGAKINHGVQTSIYTNNVALNYTFADCAIYYGNITLAGTSTGIKFVNDEISMQSTDTLTVASTTYGVSFIENKWYTNPGVVSTTSANILWLNNVWISGPITGTVGYARYDNLLYDQTMGIGAIDPFGRSYGKSFSVHSASSTAGFEVDAAATNAYGDFGVAGTNYFEIAANSTQTTLYTQSAESMFFGYNKAAKVVLNSADFSPQTTDSEGLGTSSKEWNTIFGKNVTISALSTAGNVQNSSAGLLSTTLQNYTQATADLTAQSAAGNITTFTVGASTATFEIKAYLAVTAISTDIIETQVTFTDENNTAQTANFYMQGATSQLISTTGYVPYPPMIIRAKNATVITVKTTLINSSGSITYDAGARIVQQ